MIKKLIVLALTSILCIGMLALSCVSAQEVNTANENVLYKIGIFEEENINLTDFPTRAEAAKAVIRLMGIINVPSGIATSFDDVDTSHEMSGYISYALNTKIISDSQNFYPDNNIKYEEFVKMVVCALGYSDSAQYQGGYPTGYLTVASDLGLLKNVNSLNDNIISMRDFQTILVNALDVELAGKIYYITESGAVGIYQNTSGTKETVLSSFFGINIYKAKINDIDWTERTIKAQIISAKKNSDSSFVAGEIVTLSLSNKITTGDFKHIDAEIWVDEENVVYNIIADKNTQVVIGYLDEVNKEHNTTAGNDPRQIQTIAIIGNEDYYDVADDCAFYFNGERVTSGKVMFVGSYVRAVIKNDEVISLQAWELKEGGLITQINDNNIIYQSGDSTGLKVDNLSSYNDLSFILNLEKTEKYALVPGMLFDYYADEDYDELIIVASSRAITDMFKGYNSTTIYLGEHEYILSKDYTVNVSTDGETYNSTNTIIELGNGLATAYLDYAGFVRYIKKSFYDENDAEFYGIITGYDQKGLENPKLKLFRLYSDKVVEMECELSDNIVMNGITVSALTSEIGLIDDTVIDGEISYNNGLKQAELLYKFRLNSKGQISYINHPNLFDQSPEGGATITAFSALSYGYLGSPRIYFRTSPILALYYENGIKASYIPWSELKSKTCTGSVRLDFYSEPDSSIIDLVLMRGDIDLISNGREEYIRYGLVTEKNITYDKVAGEEKVELIIDGNSYKVTQKVAADINVPSYIVHQDTISLNTQNDLVVRSTYPLKGKPGNWNTIAGTTGNDGLNTGTLAKVDDTRLYIEENDIRMYYATGCQFYKVVNTGNSTKFLKAEQNDLYVGATVWYVYYLSEVRAVFIL